MAAPLLERGVAVVALTLGEGGAYVCVSSDEARLRNRAELSRAAAGWCGQQARLAALPVAGELNANGAGAHSAAEALLPRGLARRGPLVTCLPLHPSGDAFTAGLLAAMLWSEPLQLDQAVHLGLASARQRIDGARAGEQLSVSGLLGALQAAV